MIRIEHIRQLESKIQNAVELLGQYKKENRLLKNQLTNYEGRITELENLIDQYKDEQGEIEQGIIKALQQLDNLENLVGNLKDEPVSTAPAGQKDNGEQPEPGDGEVSVQGVAPKAEEARQPVTESGKRADEREDEERADEIQNNNPSVESPSQADNGTEEPSQADNGTEEPSQADNGTEEPSQADDGTEEDGEEENEEEEDDGQLDIF